MKVKSAREIVVGDLVTWISHKNGTVSITRYSQKKNPVGVAARNIKKGEMIEWNPSKNKGDILIKTTMTVEVQKVIKI